MRTRRPTVRLASPQAVNALLALVAVVVTVLAVRAWVVGSGPSGGAAGRSGTNGLAAGGSAAVPSGFGAQPGSSAGATGAPGAKLTVVERVTHGWTDKSGAARVQLVVVARNDSPAPVRLPASATSYDVHDQGGGSIASGTFAFAFPEVVQPHATAWFVDTVAAPFGRPPQVGRIDVAVAAEPADATEAAPSHLRVLDAHAQPAGTSVAVTGEVVNRGSRAALDPIVGTLLRDARGGIAGAAFDSTGIGALGAGQQDGFRASFPGLPPLAPNQVGRIEVVAFDHHP